MLSRIKEKLNTVHKQGVSEVFRYIGPGIIVNGRVYRPGELGGQLSGRGPIRLQFVMGCYAFNDYAHLVAT